MKRNTLAALPLVVCAAFGSTAMAADNTVTFTGEVTASSCTGQINGTDVAAVTLNPVSASVLPAVNSVSAPTFFNIDLAGCTAMTPHIARAYFYQTTGTAGRLNKDATDAEPGSGWQYQLVDSTGAPITVGTSATINAANNNTDPGLDVSSGGGGALSYGVRYYRTGGPLVHGKLKATATYVIFSS